MPIIQLILIIALIGFLLWAVTTFIPMEPRIKQILVGAVVILLVLWLISMFFPGLNSIRIGH